MATALAIALGVASREGPLRVLVLADGDRERQLATRVEGQTADLDVAIEVGTVPAGLEGPEKDAAALAELRKGRAEVVVWFFADGEGWSVHVAHGERHLLRRVQEPAGALSASAADETAALVVRTALRGLVSAEPPDEPPPAAARPSLRFWGGVGWTGVYDGSGTPGHHGVEARGGVAVGVWRAGLEAGFNPSETLSSGRTSISVDRLVVGATAGVTPWETPWLRWGVELGAGAARYHRVTEAVDPAFNKTSSRDSWSPLLRPTVSLSVRLVSVLWVSLALGADVVLRRPFFDIQKADGFQTIASTWAFQPRASLTLVVDVL